MRRIIERVVTVVTTTTWKISWETDPPESEPVTDPVFTEPSNPEVLPDITRPGRAVIQTKEVHLFEEENAPDQH